MGSGSNEKELLRTEMRKKRQELSNSRRLVAEASALKTLDGLFQTCTHVLSYYSFGDEFSTKNININLIKKKKLLLPRVEGDELHIYQVDNLSDQLENHAYGFKEPIPTLCQQVELTESTMILVPGIAFDNARHRLGFGKGYYDRFLANLPDRAKTYGLGFQEQLVDEIPVHGHDVHLHGLFLF